MLQASENLADYIERGKNACELGDFVDLLSASKGLDLLFPGAGLSTEGVLAAASIMLDASGNGGIEFAPLHDDLFLPVKEMIKGL